MSDRGLTSRERQSLDRYITGNYGEDQFRKRGRVSQHHSNQHPAVGAVACPYCLQPKGVPCVTTEKRSAGPRQATEAHNARVKQYFLEDADEGRAGSQEPGE